MATQDDALLGAHAAPFKLLECTLDSADSGTLHIELQLRTREKLVAPLHTLTLLGMEVFQVPTLIFQIPLPKHLRHNSTVADWKVLTRHALVRSLDVYARLEHESVVVVAMFSTEEIGPCESAQMLF